MVISTTVICLSLSVVDFNKLWSTLLSLMNISKISECVWTEGWTNTPRIKFELLWPHNNNRSSSSKMITDKRGHFSPNFYLFSNNCHRPTLPMRIKGRCLRSTAAASASAQLKPIKKAHAFGSKTKDQLLRGEPTLHPWSYLCRGRTQDPTDLLMEVMCSAAVRSVLCCSTFHFFIDLSLKIWYFLGLFFTSLVQRFALIDIFHSLFTPLFLFPLSVSQLYRFHRELQRPVWLKRRVWR